MFVIIGGNGFIGKHLRAHISSIGSEVTIVSRSTIEQLRANEYTISSEMFDGKNGDDVIRQNKVLIFLASSSVPSTYSETPWMEVRENVEFAFRTFCRVAELNPLIKIILISSGGTIYGNQPERVISEDTAPAPISGYGLGKLMIEEALRFVNRTKGLPFTILRVSNPIGVYQVSRTQGIVTNAIRAALGRKPLTIFGDGSQVRDYLDADDVAEAVIAASFNETNEISTFNISSGIGYSVLDMLAFVEEATGRTVITELRPPRGIDIQHIVLDSSLAREKLNWVSQRPIIETIRSISREFQKQLS